MDNRNLWGRKAAVLGLHHRHLCPCTHAAVSSSCLSSVFPHEDLVLGFSVLVAQSWSTLCDPPWTVLHQAPLSMEFSRQEYWSRWLSPSPGDLPSPGIKPRSPALQVEFFPAEPQGKPNNTGVGGLSLLQWIFLPQESNQGLLHCRWILYPLNCQGNSQRVRSQNQISVQVFLADPLTSYYLRAVATPTSPKTEGCSRFPSDSLIQLPHKAKVWMIILIWCSFCFPDRSVG